MMNYAKSTRGIRPAKKPATLRRAALGLAISACFAAPAWSLPTGAQVVAGQASISQSGNSLNIANTPGAIINWANFSVGALESVRFQQQSALSSVLNRVTGAETSAIYGALSSNGRVWLINPNGILFGGGARVDIPGFIASTLAVSDSDFLAGKMNFNAGALAGSIRNEGTLNGSGGNIYLVAPDIENSGIIRAPNGEVLLAAGRQVSLVDGGHPDIQMVVSAPSDKAVNLGEIVTQNGRISLFGALLQQKGNLSADSVEVDDRGRIVFRGTQKVELAAGSVTRANGQTGGGVSIRNAGDTLVSGEVSTTGSTGTGGTVEVLGNRVAVMDNAVIDASGETGGGRIMVGGDYQGKNAAVPNSQVTYFGPQATLKADATKVGAGGTVIVWADDTTRAFGSISARGGSEGGNGGLVETSAHHLETAGIRVNAGASHGEAGTWLLDPWNVTISSLATYGGTTLPNFNFDATGYGANVYAGDIMSALGTGHVYVSTGGSGTEAGDMTVSAPIIWNTANILTLSAYGGLAVEAPISSTSTGQINLFGDYNGVVINSAISTGGLVHLESAVAGNVVVQQPTGSITAGQGVTVTVPGRSFINYGGISIGDGQTARQLSVNGSFQQMSTGKLGLGVARGDNVNVYGGGNVAIAGALDMLGTQPANSSNTPIITYGGGTHSGTFSAFYANGSPVPASYIYTYSNGVLTAPSGPATCNSTCVFDNSSADGNWTNPLNWATDMLPGGSANVQIPSAYGATISTDVGTISSLGGLGSLTFATGGNLSITAVASYGSSIGSLNMTGGTLSTLDNLTVGSLNMSGAAMLNGANISGVYGGNSLLVNSSFAQTGGGIQGFNTVEINVPGNLTVGNIAPVVPYGGYVNGTADGMIKLSGASIGQNAGTTLAGGAVSANATGAVTLTQNNPTGVIAGQSTSGNFSYTSANPISIANVGGMMGLYSAGYTKLSSSGGIAQSQPILAYGGLALSGSGSGYLGNPGNFIPMLAASFSGTGASFSVTQGSSPGLTIGTVAGIGGITLGSGSYLGLDTMGQNIVVSSPISAPSGTVEIYGAGSITGSALINTNTLFLSASGNIGPLYTQVANLSANADGNITITNNGALNITAAIPALVAPGSGPGAMVPAAVVMADSVTAYGGVMLSASGLNINGGGVGGGVRSVTGDVTVNVSGNIALSSYGGIAAGNDVILNLSGATSSVSLGGSSKIVSKLSNSPYGGPPVATTYVNFSALTSGGFNIDATSGIYHYDALGTQLASTKANGGLVTTYYVNPASTYSVNTILSSGSPSHRYGATPDAVFDYTLSSPLAAGETVYGAAVFTPTISSLTPTGTFTVLYDSGLSTNYSSTFIPGAGLTYTVNPAILGIVTASITGTVSKVYDGTTTALLAPGNFLLTGFVNNDSATVTKTTGSYATANAGSGIVVSTSLDKTDFSPVGTTVLANYTLPTSASGAIGSITPAGLNLSLTGVAALNKIYDGSTWAGFTGGALQGVIGSDKVSFTLVGNFADRHAGSGKPVTLSGATLAGSAAGNYLLAPVSANYTANITPNPLVAWIGNPTTSDGLWSNSGNWANGALPDFNNVLAVSIPAGANVTYDAKVLGTTTLQRLDSAGQILIAAGSLDVSNAFSTSRYAQTGGTLSGQGSFTVSEAFSKTGGLFTMDGPIRVNQASGNLLFVHDAPVQIVSLTAPTGGVTVINTGATNIGGSGISAYGGIDITAKSPLTIDAPITSTSGGVSLTASFPGVLTFTPAAEVTAPGPIVLASTGGIVGTPPASATSSNNNDCLLNPAACNIATTPDTQQSLDNAQKQIALTQQIVIETTTVESTKPIQLTAAPAAESSLPVSTPTKDEDTNKDKDKDKPATTTATTDTAQGDKANAKPQYCN